ncbi:LOW QUALITY PROTEIN: hypothetical protein HJC23_009570, partial [Cyclotella cryptica]
LPTNGPDERKQSGQDLHFHSKHRSNIITIENDTASLQSSHQKYQGIQASYYINEDDMVVTDNVRYGAGLLLKMIFDAMGFCQQLEHASGNEGMAQIIPNSLEMALIPNSYEARVITLAKEPFTICQRSMDASHQLDVKDKSLTILHVHDFSSVALVFSACSLNVHYDVNGREFLNFMCSYPLTNPHNEVTHMLRICQELPARLLKDKRHCS